MNILYIAEFFPPERVAGAYRAHAISKGLSNRGHNIVVLTTYPNFPTGKRFNGYGKTYNKYEHLNKRLEVLRFPIIERPNTTISNRLLMYLSFFVLGFFYFLFHIRLFRKKKFDIVLGSSGPIFVSWLAWWISALLHSKLVVEYRDLGYMLISDVGMSRRAFVNKLFKKIELAPARHAKLIFVLTNGFRTLLQKEGFSKEKIFVVPNGVTVEDNDRRESNNLGNESLVIGYFGAFGVSQNLSSVINAMLLLKDYPVSLLLVGDGAEKSKLKKIIEENKIQRVKMYGSVTRPQLEKFYNMCDICLVSLKCTKNFSVFIPSKIFDIMAHKKPILFIGPEGEASSIIQQAGAGIFIFDDDPSRIASVIKEMIKNDKEKFLQMGEKGYNFVAKNYDWRLIVKKYENVLLSSLGLLH